MEQEILNRLDAIATAIGTSVETLWSAAVAVGFAEGVASLVIAGVLGTIGIVGLNIPFIAHKRYMNKEDRDSYNAADPYVAVGITGAIIGVISSIIAIANIYSAVLLCLAPERKALELLIKLTD